MRTPLYLSVNDGFSLIESLIAMAVIGVLIVGGLVSTGTFRSKSQLPPQVNQIAALFESARTDAIKTRHPVCVNLSKELLSNGICKTSVEIIQSKDGATEPSCSATTDKAKLEAGNLTSQKIDFGELNWSNGTSNVAPSCTTQALQLKFLKGSGFLSATAPFARDVTIQFFGQNDTTNQSIKLDFDNNGIATIPQE